MEDVFPKVKHKIVPSIFPMALFVWQSTLTSRTLWNSEEEGEEEGRTWASVSTANVSSQTSQQKEDNVILWDILCYFILDFLIPARDKPQSYNQF